MNKPKNIERLIEQHLENLPVRPRAEMDRRIVRHVTEAMKAAHQTREDSARTGIGRLIVMYRTRRVAALLALAVILAGAIGLGGGPVAFSQVGQAVNSTLARLKEMIWQIRTGEPASPMPAPAAPADDVVEPAPHTDPRAVTCGARFFRIPADEQTPWQSLADQGIELVLASAGPETYYAVLSREQCERFESALTIGPVTSPRVTVGEGGEAMIASGIFALAWRPTLSTDGERIASSFSFHDGETGFEIPNIHTENGGVILVRVRGITSTGEDVVILLTISVPPAS